MVFTLTDELCQQIIKNLENQNEKFYVDAENSCLVSKTDSSFNENLINQKFYDLPEWNSQKGFELMQNFVKALHSPLAKSELQKILYSGRGVFKSFKTELKNYPQVEKVWHSYKNRKMNNLVKLWYDELCENWGLEKLEIDSDLNDENLDLLKYDFSFREYDFSKDEGNVLRIFRENAFIYDCDYSKTVAECVFNFWRNQFLCNKNNQKGYICNSLDNEFAGIITILDENQNKTEKVAILSSFFVLEKFRGLGIGKNLLEMCIKFLKDKDFKWILLMYTAIPDSLENLLKEFDFKKTEFGFLKEV